MDIGDYIFISFLLVHILGWIPVAWGKYKDKCVRYDVFMESGDGEVMQITSGQKENSFYIIDDLLCYFDRRQIKMYLRLEPDCKVFCYRRKIKWGTREM